MATVSAMLASRRKAIFAACRQLGLDDDTRREMLRKVAGVGSTKDLGLDGCQKVLDHLRSVGAARTPKAKAVGQHPGTPQKWQVGAGELVSKIEAQLADMKLSWAYATAILKRVSQKGGKPVVERLEFATPAMLKDVVAALAYEQQKRAMLEDVTAKLKQRGLTLDDAPSLQPGLPENWQRNIRALRALLVRLAPMPEPI